MNASAITWAIEQCRELLKMQKCNIRKTSSAGTTKQCQQYNSDGSSSLRATRQNKKLICKPSTSLRLKNKCSNSLSQKFWLTDIADKWQGYGIIIEHKNPFRSTFQLPGPTTNLLLMPTMLME
jgi:hypothetical protein